MTPAPHSLVLSDVESVLSGLVASWYGVPVLGPAALGVPHSLVKDLPDPAINNDDLFDLAQDIAANLQLVATVAAKQALRVRVRPIELFQTQPKYRFEFLTYLAF